MGEDETETPLSKTETDEVTAQVTFHFVGMSLVEKIQKDVMAAVKASNEEESDILRIVLSALKNAQISKDGDDVLTEEEELKVVFSEGKKVKDSIEQFVSAGRNELAEREKHQLAVIEKYLPSQADEDEITAVAKRIIDETGASNMANLGMVMGSVMKELQGRADGKAVRDIVQGLLS